MPSAKWKRIWCYYRNLVHTVYREIRHIGDTSDSQAKCIVGGDYLLAATKCRANRATLKSTVPYHGETGTHPDDAIRPYQALTSLTLEQLVDIFRDHEWAPSYGGVKWATVTEVLMKLKQEIEQGNLDAALQTCEEVKTLHHNSGPVVPSPQEWEENSWIREKWPELCEDNE